MKFRRPVTISALKEFQRSLRNRLVYLSKTTGHELAVYYAIEGEQNNCVHYHLLIRTTVADIELSLGYLVEKASRGVATLQHCAEVRNVEATTRYVVKDLNSVRNGCKEVLLFKPGLGLRQCGSWNHYFTKAKSRLWQDAKAERYGDPERSVPQIADRLNKSHSLKFSVRVIKESFHLVAPRESRGYRQSDVVWSGLRLCSTIATLFNTCRVSVPQINKRRRARWSRDGSGSPLKSSAKRMVVECNCHRRV